MAFEGKPTLFIPLTGLPDTGFSWVSGGVGIYQRLSELNAYSIAVIFQQPRPGPPLPKGEYYLTIGWKQIWHAVKQYKKLPHTFTYLFAFFLLSDVSCHFFLYYNNLTHMVVCVGI